MESKYIYKTQDITLDLIMKIEQIVWLIGEKENKEFDDCYLLFMNSKTYQTLKNTESLLWAENAEFIVDEYYRELR